jgi:anti-sigma factor RsiW
MTSNNETRLSEPPPCSLVDDYLVGELSGDAAVRFERHLEQCAECRAAIDEQRWIDGLLQSPEASALEVAPVGLAGSDFGQAVHFRRRKIARRSVAAAAAASLAAVALWRFVGQAQHEKLAEAPGFTQGANEFASASRAVTSRQSREPAEDKNAATFISTDDAIAVSLPSSDSDVSIVQLYPTTDVQRREQRQLSHNAYSFGLDGG